MKPEFSLLLWVKMQILREDFDGMGGRKSEEGRHEFG